MGFATQGAAPIFGSGAVAFSLYAPGGGSAISGYIMPTVTGYNITHGLGTTETKDESGDIDAVTFHGEYIECAFTLLPTGSTSGNALTSAKVPAPGSTMTISGAPASEFGSFTDALNVSGSTLPQSARWIYAGGGSIQRSSDGHATLNLTFRRYPLIVGGTAITS
jgi:hypothetical protein